MNLRVSPVCHRTRLRRPKTRGRCNSGWIGRPVVRSLSLVSQRQVSWRVWPVLMLGSKVDDVGGSEAQNIRLMGMAMPEAQSPI